MPARHNYQNYPGNVANRPGYVVSGLSGSLTIIAAAADVFGLRNVGSEPLVVSGVRLAWYTTTAFGAAQSLAFGVWKAVGFTAIHDTGSGLKEITALPRRTNNPALTEGTDIETAMSNAVAISNGTYTAVDADEPLGVGVAGGNLSPGLYFNWTPPDGIPLVLEADEGLVVKNQILMGATGVGVLHVAVDFRR